MQTQNERVSTSKTSYDQVIAYIVFAVCCVLSFLSEPQIAEVLFTSNP